MKNAVIKTVKVICFLAGLWLIIFHLNKVLILKDAEEKYSVFYKEAQKYDVLFTGSSHVQVAVSPLELWKDYGIASFNLAETDSRIPTSYWVLRNALQYSNPKLVVMDVRRIDVDEHSPEMNTHRQFDRMPLSLLKLEAILDLFKSWDERVEMLVPFTVYHGRWTELKRNDFTAESVRINKGSTDYGTNVKVIAPKEFEVLPETEKERKDTLSAKYFEKMIQMCQDQGIEVLLINVPYVATSDEMQRYENGVADIASQYHVNYINFLHMEGIVDYNTDMHNNGHLNPSGMNKVTEYLGNYIRENYDVPDRREEADYSTWNLDYETFTDYKFHKMGGVETADSNLILLADKNINSCIYVKEGSSIFADPRYRKLIQNVTLGKQLIRLQEAMEEGKDYLLIVEHNRNKISEYVGLSASEYVQASFGNVEIGSDDADGPFLRIDDPETNYLTGEPDIQMIAIDARTGNVRNVGAFNVMVERTGKR